MSFDFSHFKQFEEQINWRQICQSNQRFIDPQFKPELNSLYDQQDTQLSQQKLETWNKIEWHRPQEIFKGHDYKVFYQGIKPNDIQQGSLGNCYFLSAIAAIAQFPFRVAQIFQTDYANEAGCYAVRFCINGEFKDIVIDDNFPCYQNSTKPCFSYAKGYELWVLLLEKAWAKINRNYQATIAGWCSEALRTLTGAPCYYLPHKDNVDLWEQIVTADQKKFIICASAGQEDMTDQEFNQMGLISNHAYSIISAVEVQTQEGPVKLLKLRNPWGHKEWSGDWSDTSDKWTPQLKELLGLQVADDGQFWISLQDYTQFYNSTTICKIRESFQMQSLRLHNPMGKSCGCLVTVLQKNTRIYFTASQYRWRMFPKNSGYRASFIKMILCKVGEAFDYEKYQYIDARGTRAEDTTIQCEQGLDPGRYLVWIEAQWQFDQIETVFFNTYSDKPVQLQKYNIDPIKFLPQVLKSCALQKSKRKSYENKGDPDIFRCMSISDSKCEYGYVYYQNNSKKDRSLIQMLKFTKLDNYQLLDTGENPQQLHTTIRPGQNKIYVLKRTSRSASYSYTFYATIKKSNKELQSMIDEVLDQRNQIVFHGQPLQIYYTVFPHETGYMWKFWNETQDVRFEGEFEFDFQNMEFEDQQGNVIEVILGPGDTEIKSIIVTDLSKGYSYKNSFSYKCIDEE